MFHMPWSAALQEQLFIVAILQLWLWTRLRLYIALYPLAVAVLLTNTPGTSWHSQKVTLSVLKPSGTDSHRRKRRVDWLEGYKKKEIGPLQRKVTAVECAYQSAARVSSVLFEHSLVHKVYWKIPNWILKNKRRRQVRNNKICHKNEWKILKKNTGLNSSAFSSSKDASHSFWGFTKALSTGTPRPRLWHIWVMHFTLQPLDLIQQQSVQLKIKIQCNELSARFLRLGCHVCTLFIVIAII